MHTFPNLEMMEEQNEVATLDSGWFGKASPMEMETLSDFFVYFQGVWIYLILPFTLVFHKTIGLFHLELKVHGSNLF